jgi:ectoine hydroxylase-related dioxygenase (phytanoyl-CoA dioxygenase family)
MAVMSGGGEDRSEDDEARERECPEAEISAECTQRAVGSIREEEHEIAGDGQRRRRKESQEKNHGETLAEQLRNSTAYARQIGCRPWRMLIFGNSCPRVTARTPAQPPQMSFHLSQAQIDSFQADGAVVLRQLLEPPEVELLRQGIDENLAHPSPRAKVASRGDDPGFFLEDFCCWQENPLYRRVIFQSSLGEVGAGLMQSRCARLYHDHMLTKEPGTRARTPWHQDQPYYNVEGRQNCSFWIPVDPVERTATLEFVGGSHRGPWLMPRSFMDAEAKWFPEGTLADLPDIEAQRQRYRILGWALEPGDAVCFHMLTLHASAGVSTGRRRRVFSVRLLGDDARHAPRRWKTSPDFPALTETLPEGAPMEHPLFPLLWAGEGRE